MNLNANREHLLRCLREIPELAEEARATRGTNPVSSDGARGRRVPGSVVLADLDRIMAGDCANDHSGVGVLSTWVRAIEDELDEEGTPYAPAEGNVAACCAWLAAHVGWVEANWLKVGMSKPLPMFIAPDHPDGLPADIHRLWATLRGICRVRESRPLGCLTTGCGGHMRPAEDGDYLECDNGHRHSGLSKWRYHPSVPIPDAAAKLNVSERTIRHWARRGGPVRVDESKGALVRHVWPWDVLRVKFPELVEAIEAA